MNIPTPVEKGKAFASRAVSVLLLVGVPHLLSPLILFPVQTLYVAIGSIRKGPALAVQSTGGGEAVESLNTIPSSRIDVRASPRTSSIEPHSTRNYTLLTGLLCDRALHVLAL